MRGKGGTGAHSMFCLETDQAGVSSQLRDAFFGQILNGQNCPSGQSCHISEPKVTETALGLVPLATLPGGGWAAFKCARQESQSCLSVPHSAVATSAGLSDCRRRERGVSARNSRRSPWLCPSAPRSPGALRPTGTAL